MTSATPPPERFPTNKVVALLGPYIAVLAGTLAAWLSQHFPGLADDVDAETQSITQAITFAVGALVSWALQHKYLDGWQRWEQAVLDACHPKHAQPAPAPAAAQLAPAVPPAPDPLAAEPPEPPEPFEVDPAIVDDLVAPATGPALGDGRPSDG